MANAAVRGDSAGRGQRRVSEGESGSRACYAILLHASASPSPGSARPDNLVAMREIFANYSSRTLAVRSTASSPA